ncbi:MAG: hypothetical protein WDN72_00710 [Alphaproteobacteria bacterium]
MADISPVSPSPEDATAVPVANDNGVPPPANDNALSTVAPVVDAAAPMPAPNELANEVKAQKQAAATMGPMESLTFRPPHTQTKSNLSPTSEFTRMLMLVFTSRYGLRGASKLLYPSNVPFQQLSYSLGMGVGSGALSLGYGRLVKADIATSSARRSPMSGGVSPDNVSFKDMSHSDNVIVQRTMHNYHVNSASGWCPTRCSSSPRHSSSTGSCWHCTTRCRRNSISRSSPTR